MFIIFLFSIQFLIVSKSSLLGIYCIAQQPFVIRDPRIRPYQTYVTNQTVPNGRFANLNASLLLQQFPSIGYRTNSNDKKYQQYYSLPHRNTPPEIAQYRNLGNYYQDLGPPTPQPISTLPVPIITKVEHKRHSEYAMSSTPLRFDTYVFHLNRKAPKDIRPRRYTNVTTIGAQFEEKSSKALEPPPSNSQLQKIPLKNLKNEIVSERSPTTTIREAQTYHDIFMRYNGPHKLSFGHVELNPQKHFQKRFESLNNINGNRNRGEIIWTDAQGGYGEHHWDLAQGKLR